MMKVHQHGVIYGAIIILLRIRITTQRRQSGLKSGGRGSGSKKFDFLGKFPKNFDFFRQFHKKIDFSGQIFVKF